MNPSLPDPSATANLPHIPVYSITYAELTMIGVFFLVTAYCLFRRKDGGALLLFFAAVCFTLRPLLVFTIPSQHVVNLTAYCPSIAFGALTAFVVVHAMGLRGAASATEERP
jgi:hypothetical protein